MIYLEASNDIIFAEILRRSKMSKKERFKTPFKVDFPDYDGTEFSITSEGLNSKDKFEKEDETVYVSLKVLGEEVVKSNGLDEILKKEFPNNFTEAKKGQTATLKVEIDKFKNEEDLVKELKKVSCVRRYVLMPPLVKAMETFLSGGTLSPVLFPYREEESIYVLVADKSLIVIFTIKFQDPDDVTLAHVFFNEFKDARRDTSLGNAPSVNFTEGKKPLELEKFKGCREPNDPSQLKDYGFVAFSIREEHCQVKNRDNTLDLLFSFRNYLQYHLNCSKAFMHYKMRSRYQSLLEGLEDAKDKSGIKKVRKTFQGKTFTQK